MDINQATEQSWDTPSARLYTDGSVDYPLVEGLEVPYRNRQLDSLTLHLCDGVERTSASRSQQASIGAQAVGLIVHRRSAGS